MTRGIFVLTMVSSLAGLNNLRFRPDIPGLPYLALIISTVSSDVAPSRCDLHLFFNESLQESYIVKTLIY